MWLCGLQQGVVVNHTVRSMLDNDIHNSRCVNAVYIYGLKVQVYSWFIQILTLVCDDLCQSIKTRVVTDGRTDKIAQVIARTLRLHFAARVNYYGKETACDCFCLSVTLNQCSRLQKTFWQFIHIISYNYIWTCDTSNNIRLIFIAFLHYFTVTVKKHL